MLLELDAVGMLQRQTSHGGHGQARDGEHALTLPPRDAPRINLGPSHASHAKASHHGP